MIEPLAYQGCQGLVTGQWYSITVLGGEGWHFWVPRKLARNEARAVALDFINGSYDPLIYEADDIDSVRAVKASAV